MKLKLVAITIVLLVIKSSWSATITVTNTNNGGAGSLRNAISISASGDIIDMTGISGTILLTSGQLDCSGKNLTLNGPGASNLTISGNNSSRIIYTWNASISLDGLTLSNGLYTTNAYSGGAALASYGSGDVNLTNCLFINNTSTSGYSRGGAVDIANYDPLSWVGGTSSKVVRISYCQFENNVGYIGGAMVFRTYNTGGSLFTVKNTTFKNNSNVPTNGNDGGAFECAARNDDNLLFENCTFSGNSTVSTGGNAKDGGALSLGNGTVNFNSCTITNNSSGSVAGGIAHWGSGTCTVTNSIIANNTSVGTGANVNGNFISGGFNIIGNNGTANGFNAGTDMNSTNPLLAGLANNGGFGETHAIDCSSPAIDTGGGNPALDQRDLPRVCDPDIGAFEFQTACNCVPLPIELLYFRAEAEDRKVKLNWETISEINNDYFVVERSKDAIVWEHVLHKEGAGNTTEQQFYEDYDEWPYDGLSYYRLTQVDFDGQSTTSQIETVNFLETNESPISVSPTISNGEIQITIFSKIESTALLIIYDDLGRVVHEQAVHLKNGANTVNNSLNKLSAGVYQLKVKLSESYPFPTVKFIIR